MPSSVLIIMLVLCTLSLVLLISLYGKHTVSYVRNDRYAVRACILIELIVIGLLIWTLASKHLRFVLP
jgi:Na+/alanine symporter